MKAWLNLRHSESERGVAFARGLKRMGYEVQHGITCSPGPRDLFCSWNRIGQAHTAARAFQAAGRPVLVCENSSWGNTFAGRQWLHLARTFHNTAGMFPIGGPERFDALQVELAPWRTDGETVILAQRGIGCPETAMPRGWPQQQRGRLRLHPGRNEFAKPLADDLKAAGKVITWGSAAAVQALVWGIPVESHMPGWIAEQNNTDAGRLAMFRQLAWAQVRMDEIESGEAFARLL